LGWVATGAAPSPPSGARPGDLPIEQADIRNPEPVDARKFDLKEDRPG
jgi:hypothetical protein